MLVGRLLARCRAVRAPLARRALSTHAAHEALAAEVRQSLGRIKTGMAALALGAALVPAGLWWGRDRLQRAVVRAAVGGAAEALQGRADADWVTEALGAALRSPAVREAAAEAGADLAARPAVRAALSAAAADLAGRASVRTAAAEAAAAVAARPEVRAATAEALASAVGTPAVTGACVAAAAQLAGDARVQEHAAALVRAAVVEDAQVYSEVVTRLSQALGEAAAAPQVTQSARQQVARLATDPDTQQLLGTAFWASFRSLFSSKSANKMSPVEAGAQGVSQ